MIKEYFKGKDIILYQGDVLDENNFKEEFIDLIVTSPPYGVIGILPIPVSQREFFLKLSRILEEDVYRVVGFKPEKIVKKVEKKEIPKVKKETLYKAIPTNKFTAITPKTLHVATKEKEKEKTITKTAEKKETIEVKKEEPYTFHLEPTEQLNELFSSSGKLTFNTPYNIKKPPKKVVKKTCCKFVSFQIRNSIKIIFENTKIVHLVLWQK